MMRFLNILAVFVLAAALAGCQTTRGQKQTFATVFGAVLGGVVGSQFGSGTGKLVATGAGVFLGGLLGSEIGRAMDESDRMKVAKANRRARIAPIDETITWNNPSTGYSGSVTPVREGTSTSGQYCREFQQTVSIGGRTERAYGTACRKPDGSWQVQ